MENKKGLSQVITTIIIIAIALIIIATFAIILNEFFKGESSKLRLDKITTGLKIEKAIISLENETVNLKIFREKGEGNVTGIKIMIEDDEKTINFDNDIDLIKEFEKRTINLNLINSGIIASKIKRITVIPIITSRNNEETLGKEFFISGKDLIKIGIGGIEEEIIEGDEGEETSAECTINSECGLDILFGNPYCSTDKTKIMQYEKVYECIIGFCVEKTYERIIKICDTNQICKEGTCIDKPKACTNETVNNDCGEYGWVGVEKCSVTAPERIVRDFRECSCINEVCECIEFQRTVSTCAEEEECIESRIEDGKREVNCIFKPECTTNDDCPELLMVCNSEGKCVQEIAIDNGTVLNLWPFGLGEYFDSNDLPKEGLSYKDLYIIFPESNQFGCLRISQHVFPNNPQDNSYIKLNSQKTNISSGDFYEIWESIDICTIASEN